MEALGVHPSFVFFLSLPLLAVVFCLIPYLFARVFLDTIRKAVGMGE